MIARSAADFFLPQRQTRLREVDRHTIAEFVETRNRLSGNWWMGLATRNKQTAPAFEPYLKHGNLRPQDMSADSVLKLMVALCGEGLPRNSPPWLEWF